MTLFEYLAIAFSLVFSFSALRILGGLSYLLRPGRVYWVHLAQTIVSLLMVTIVFWVFWSMREVQWSYPKFLLALAGPSALYFLATTLVPDTPSGVESWRDYYYSVRVRLFSALGLWAILAAVTATALLEMPLNHPARLGQVFALALAVVGVLSKNPRVHATLAVVQIAGLVALGGIVFFEPGSLAE